MTNKEINERRTLRNAIEILRQENIGVIQVKEVLLQSLHFDNDIVTYELSIAGGSGEIGYIKEGSGILSFNTKRENMLI